tara:strand:+ start:13 stop:555 length:543 start_codon:yes stop_codon:yes gene_type:complete
MTRSRIQELTGEIFHEKRRSCPGSTTYYLENTEKKERYDPSSSYKDEELMDLQKYIPYKLTKNLFLGKTPKEIVLEDGWIWDETKNTYTNKSFTNQDGSFIQFKGVIKQWGVENYLVPMAKEGVIDKEGLCWSFHNISTCWSLSKNTPIDFWQTRKGKKMAKYIEYRKRRTNRNDMLSQN